MSKYVLTHQPNLVNLYVLDPWVACDLLANPSRWWRLLIIIWKHILGAIGGRLIGTQHRNVPLMENLAPPRSGILLSPESGTWLSPDIGPRLSPDKGTWLSPGPRPWLAADADLCLNPIIWHCIAACAGICPNPTAYICISPVCGRGNLSSCVSLSDPHGIGPVYVYGKYGA
jgi:hypothetical protein